MRRGGDGQAVVLGVADHVAADADPLPAPVGEVGRAVEADLDDVARQQLRLQDVQLEEGAPQTHDLARGLETDAVQRQHYKRRD